MYPNFSFSLTVFGLWPFKPMSSVLLTFISPHLIHLLLPRTFLTFPFLWSSCTQKHSSPFSYIYSLSAPFLFSLKASDKREPCEICLGGILRFWGLWAWIRNGLMAPLVWISTWMFSPFPKRTAKRACKAIQWILGWKSRRKTRWVVDELLICLVIVPK